MLRKRICKSCGCEYDYGHSNEYCCDICHDQMEDPSGERARIEEETEDGLMKDLVYFY